MEANDSPKEEDLMEKTRMAAIERLFDGLEIAMRAARDLSDEDPDLYDALDDAVFGALRLADLAFEVEAFGQHRPFETVEDLERDLDDEEDEE